MLKPIEECHTMGVLNITPNSFSDGGKYLEKSVLLSTLEEYKKYPDLIFDFGFESTAPMNRAIDSQTEKKRMMDFLDQIVDVDLSMRWISVDTYQLNNFLYFYDEIKKRYPTCGIILNDVSGVLDQPLVDCLSLMKKDKNFYYLYSATNILDRDNVLEHMKCISQEDIFLQLARKIENFLAWIKSYNFNSEQIIFDPALGFSKTYEQNWQIIDGLKNFFEANTKYKKFIWLLGFSKKSFMQKKFLPAQDPKQESESLHAQLVNDFLLLPTRGVIFRVHDPLIVKNAPNLSKIHCI